MVSVKILSTDVDDMVEAVQTLRPLRIGWRVEDRRYAAAQLALEVMRDVYREQRGITTHDRAQSSI
jgi:hypothetical protein